MIQPLPRAARGPGPGSRWIDSPTVTLQGELDFSKREAVAAMLRPAERMKRVTLDLRAITYFDASTLGCFMHLRNAMGFEGDRRIRLLAHPYHARLLRLVGFDRFFEIVESAALGSTSLQALQSLGQGA